MEAVFGKRRSIDSMAARSTRGRWSPCCEPGRSFGFGPFSAAIGKSDSWSFLEPLSVSGFAVMQDREDRGPVAVETLQRHIGRRDARWQESNQVFAIRL